MLWKVRAEYIPLEAVKQIKRIKVESAPVLIGCWSICLKDLWQGGNLVRIEVLSCNLQYQKYFLLP